MTLTPSVRAISLCSFPRLAKLFACTSFAAIATLECFFLAMTTERPMDKSSKNRNHRRAANQHDRSESALQKTVTVCDERAPSHDVTFTPAVGGGEADS
jgi:hypothetical protein